MAFPYSVMFILCFLSANGVELVPATRAVPCSLMAIGLLTAWSAIAVTRAKISVKVGLAIVSACMMVANFVPFGLLVAVTLGVQAT